MCIDFVSLACHASLHILFYVLWHVGPPIVIAYQGSSVCDSRVPCAWEVVKKSDYPPLKGVVAHDN